jgi:hypothetical protein
MRVMKRKVIDFPAKGDIFYKPVKRGKTAIPNPRKDFS